MWDNQNMMATSTGQVNILKLAQSFLVTLSALGTFLLVMWLIEYSSYGFDFTDESFYLVWMKDPFLYDASTTQFGFIYHPLYRLFDGDIVDIRKANILITYALAWLLFYCKTACISLRRKPNWVLLIVIPAGLATISLAIFARWLLTPNYNSLNLQALMITAIGLIVAANQTGPRKGIGWVIVGVGGWLTFMAKPSSALALAIGVLTYSVAVKKFSLKMLGLGLAVALALLLVSSLLIDGSAIEFFRRMRSGVVFADYLGGGHSVENIFRIDSMLLTEELKKGILLLSLLVSCALWCMRTEREGFFLIGALISTACFVVTGSIALGYSDQVTGFGESRGLFCLALIFGLISPALWLDRKTILARTSAEQWGMAVLFLTMPFIYAFGSNMNYWRVGSAAGIFWLLGGWTLLVPLIYQRNYWVVTLPLIFASQAVTAVLLQAGVQYPYRQPQPLHLNDAQVEIDVNKSKLTLSKGYASYIERALGMSHEAGFLSGTPVIDLSGQSPGILYLIGAESIGQAWTIGDYEGSLKLAVAAYARTPCEKVSESWVLYEREGPRSIPVELMARLGTAFPDTYALAATWMTAEGAGGYSKPRKQELYKPLKQNATLVECQRLRGSVVQ